MVSAVCLPGAGGGGQKSVPGAVEGDAPPVGGGSEVLTEVCSAAWRLETEEEPALLTGTELETWEGWVTEGDAPVSTSSEAGF